MNIIIENLSLPKNLIVATCKGLGRRKRGQRNEVRLHRRPPVELRGEGESRHYPVG